MHQETKLDRFVVVVAISGINSDADPNALEDFKEIIGMRPHLTLRQINYESSSQQLQIHVLMESLDQGMAKRQMTEEFFEIANAILKNIERVRIKVLDVNNFE